MKEIYDIIKKLSVINPEHVRINQTENVLFECSNPEKTVYGWATLNTSAHFGDFVISDISMLLGLYSYEGYRQENSDIKIKFNNDNRPTSIEFSDLKGTTSSYKLADPKLFPSNKRVGNTPPDMSFNPDFEKIKNFSKLFSIFSKKEKLFWTHSEGDKLIAGFGQVNANTNQGQMILHDSGAMRLNQICYWNCVNFLNVLQIDQSDTLIKINGRGQMVVEFKSNGIDYQFAFVGQKV
jgi:hypothetical protein